MYSGPGEQENVDSEAPEIDQLLHPSIISASCIFTSSELDRLSRASIMSPAHSLSGSSHLLAQQPQLHPQHSQLQHQHLGHQDRQQQHHLHQHQHQQHTHSGLVYTSLMDHSQQQQHHHHYGQSAAGQQHYLPPVAAPSIAMSVSSNSNQPSLQMRRQQIVPAETTSRASNGSHQFGSPTYLHTPSSAAGNSELQSGQMFASSPLIYDAAGGSLAQSAQNAQQAASFAHSSRPIEAAALDSQARTGNSFVASPPHAQTSSANSSASNSSTSKSTRSPSSASSASPTSEAGANQAVAHHLTTFAADRTLTDNVLAHHNHHSSGQQQSSHLTYLQPERHPNGQLLVMTPSQTNNPYSGETDTASGRLECGSGNFAGQPRGYEDHLSRLSYAQQLDYNHRDTNQQQDTNNNSIAQAADYHHAPHHLQQQQQPGAKMLLDVSAQLFEHHANSPPNVQLVKRPRRNSASGSSAGSLISIGSESEFGQPFSEQPIGVKGER